RPAVAAQPAAVMPSAAPAASPQPAKIATPKVSREEIAAIVDRFLATRPAEAAPLPPPALVRAEAPPSPKSPPGDGGTRTTATSNASSNGRQAADSVSEDDVKRSI